MPSPWPQLTHHPQACVNPGRQEGLARVETAAPDAWERTARPPPASLLVLGRVMVLELGVGPQQQTTEGQRGSVNHRCRPHHRQAALH